ncbi:DUF5011 domain-containing protein [bacterium]|nr:DUF5011 domain-containing protein [bacterium]
MTAVTIPEGVTTIGGFAFAGCSTMAGVTLPASLISLGNYAFQACSNLGSVIIPEGVTSIGGSTFESCSGLTRITLPNTLRNIGSGAFFFCTNLASITIPDSVLEIGVNAFWNCHKLESVTIGSGVTALPGNAFSECLALTSVSLGANVKTLGDYAFNNCGKLKSITFPAGLESIGTSAFALCADLTTVTIPEGVSAIGIRAFKQCSKLATVYFQKNTPPTIYAEAFSGIATGAKGYYPSTASTAWKSITAYNDLTLVHPDTESPVITLIGANPLEIYKGAAFSDPGATVTDNKDAIRTITGSGAVNAVTVGIYTLTYTTTDAAGNLALPVTRTVNVVLNPSGDEDGDGLTNGAEMSGGMNPYQKDSDNDGVNDALEIADGTNPTNPDSFNNLNKGLVAYYPFNGNAKNMVPDPVTDLIYSGPQPTKDRFGRPGYAFKFNASGFMKSTGDLPISGNSPRTISLWLNRQNMDRGGLVGWGSGNAGYGKASTLFAEAGGRILAGGFYADKKSTGEPLVLNQWMHLAMTYVDSIGSIKIFIDGSEIASYVGESYATVWDTQSAGYPLFIGSEAVVGGATFNATALFRKLRWDNYILPRSLTVRR